MWIAIQNAVGARQGVGGGPGPGPGPGYTPPLDAYPADIAYSVRKLSSSYSGFCMEVQRVSDYATQDIGFDSDGLVDVDELAAFDDGTGLRVRTWYDQTGNSRHAQTTVAGDMSYIYGSGAVEEANGVPVVNPRGSTDGFYPITGTYSTAANNTVFAVLSAGNAGGSYLMARGSFGSSGILMAGSACPTGGCTSGPDYGFGTTQYYRDGVYYGGTGTGLTRDDFAQSSISSQRIYGVGFTQSGLNAINMSRAGNTSIYATQEYIVYFSDQLGTTPRQALEQNLNSYYRSSNLPDYTSGFLADYTGAAVAYSVRQLSNTAIKCMRVRRAVAPFDEQDIGFTAGGDLDEAAIVAFGGSDELRVSAWYDQSGQSNHATQINPSNQPQIYNGTAVVTDNGKPALEGNGSRNLSLTDLNLTGNFGIAYTGQLNVNNSPYGTSGNDFSLYALNATTLRNRLGGSNQTWTDSGVVYQSQLLYFYNRSSTSVTLRRDGSQIATATSSGTVSITSVLASPPYYLTGKMQEFIAWADTQDSAFTGIETNINDYYEIIVNDEVATSGFLFDYPNAAAAYSVRQLNNNAEFAMQVERSDGRTKNIGFDGNGDLDTQAIIDFAGASVATISQWYDQSGAQNHATQITPNSQPQIYNGTAVFTEGSVGNEKPIIRSTIDATLNYPLGNDPQQVFGVFKATQAQTNQAILGSSNNAFLLVMQSSGASSDLLFSRTLTRIDQSTYTGTSRNDARLAFQNQCILYCDYTTTATNSDLHLGFDSNFPMPDMQEVIIYPNTATHTVADVEDSINDYFRIY